MEIGSIFEIDPRDIFCEPKYSLTAYPFNEDSLNFSYFNTGRSAIEALLSYLKFCGNERIWLPSFNCSSVRDAAERAGMEVCLYKVHRNLLVDTGFNDHVSDKDIVYFVNFFGKLELDSTYAKIAVLKQQGILVVEDLTLALLSENEHLCFGDYIIGSVRKWLPITDGGFVASSKPLPEFEKEQASNDYTLYYFAAQMMKTEYLKDKKLDKQVFLDISNIGMKALFSDYKIRSMSAISERIIMATDMRKTADTRIANYDMLYAALQGVQEVELLVERQDGMCPLGILISVENRDELFRHLIANGIYCNIHWRPNDSTAAYSDSNYLAEHCLTIPCDQRYGKEEMQYISKTIKSFFNHV